MSRVKAWLKNVSIYHRFDSRCDYNNKTKQKLDEKNVKNVGIITRRGEVIGVFRGYPRGQLRTIDLNRLRSNRGQKVR